MAKKLKEKLEEFPEDKFDPSQLGTIEDLDKTQHNPIWIGLGFMVLIAIIFSSWAFLYLTRTKEDILEEKLANYADVSMMRDTAFKAIRNDLVKREELVDSIQTAIDLTKTPIRRSRHPLTPHVPERQLAMVDALEGLMRLELEGHIDRNNSGDNALFLNLLKVLGLQRLEYYEEGLLQRVPLLLSSWLHDEIDKEKSFKHANVKEIAILEKQLKEVLKQESVSVVAPAYLLGRWFRYYNDNKNARRCFEIGRRYVDGYTLGSKHFEGRRPDGFSPVWDEYVGCLESLAELAFEEKKYRQARSYLVRIFNTPNNATAFLLNQSTQKHLEVANKEIVQTEQDLSIIEKALSSPKSLTSFPFFHKDDGNIKWRLLLSNILKASQDLAGEGKKTVGSLLWSVLDPAIQAQIKKNSGVKWLTPVLQKEIISAFNDFMRKPTLMQEGDYSLATLSISAQAGLKESLVNLSTQEIASINREIINQSFHNAIENRYILSDGTSINNSLSERQMQQIVTLYKEEMLKKETGENRRQELQAHVDGIVSRKTYPRLPDLEKALTEKRNHFLEIVKQGEIIFDNQRAALKQLKQSLFEIESKGNIDIEMIKQIHKEEEVARNRQTKAEIQTKEAQKELVDLDRALGQIYNKINRKKESLLHSLEALQERQAHLRIQTVNDSEPLLEQIETQIQLRKRYLTLLRKLNGTEQENPLKKYQEQQKQLASKINDLRTSLVSSAGNEREKLLTEISELESKQNKVVREFNSIFEPIRAIIEEIAESESKVWQAEKLLKETQEEIIALIGKRGSSGIMQKKAEKRAQLLLIQPKNTVEREHYERQTRMLNDEIAQMHARLNVLLQRERLTKQTLETFYPGMSNQEGFSLFSSEGMDELRNYLQRQESLTGEYEALWQQNSLLSKVHNEETVITENFRKISDSLKSHQELSEKQTNNLSRFMRNIVQSKSRLSNYQMQLKQLKRSPHMVQNEGRESNRGFEFRLINFYKLEREMGLNITAYRRTFEERGVLVQELLEAVSEKEVLEKEQVEAAGRRDQIKYDLYVPKIAEAENRIQNLNARSIEINERLKNLADQYASQMGEVSNFRLSLFPKLKESQNRLEILNQELSRNDIVLNQLSSYITNAPVGLNKVITKIDINDFDNMGRLIRMLESQLDNLVQAQGIKQKENFYKTKSLWLIGKSAYHQSKLKSFADLVASNDISTDMVEDENRNGKIIFQEFDEKMTRSEKLFFGAAPVDENTASYQAWVDFLESYASRIFTSELPKYTPKNLMGEIEGFSFEMQEDNKVYLARSRFLLGEIYLNRALRFIKASNDIPQENQRAQQELNLSMSAFLSFLDFATPLMDKSFLGSRQLTEATSGSKEFPARSRQTLNLLNEAKIFVGVISQLQGNYQKSITFNRSILSDIKREYAILFGEENNEDGDYDPIAFSQYEYDTSLHPFYVSLLARHPLGHEVLYRMGKSYLELAKLEFKRYHNLGAMSDREKDEAHENATKYASQAVAYFSQLILTQSFSPYRNAAYLQRSKLREMLGDFYLARNDLINILGSEFNEGGSFDVTDMTLKGDLPGELNPGHAFVTFELGRLYFENKNYYAAAENFKKAQSVDHKGNFTTKAKVAYTEALVASKRWLEAYYFLDGLLKNDNLKIDNPYFYYPDLLINMGRVRKELTLFNDSASTYKKVFAYAPSELLRGDELDLSDIDALKKLNTDFRDSIRPLSIAAFELAGVYQAQYEFAKSKYYYGQAEKLFRMLKRQEDKKLRQLTDEEFQNYRQQMVLDSKWGQLKTDVLELMLNTFSRFRKVVDVAPDTPSVLSIEELNQEVEIALDHAEDQREAYAAMLDILNDFRKRESLKLPEHMERERVIAKRNRDRDWGSKVAYRYDALVNLRTFSYPLRHLEAKKLMLELKRFSEEGSLELNLLDEFTSRYAQENLRLTPVDQRTMLSANTNIENLLLMPKAEERLVDFNNHFIRWLEIEMRKTGLDDLFIPVSPQVKVLEEIDLYRISFLSFLNDFESYEKLVELTDLYLEVQATDPNRVLSPVNIWEMVEIASYSAEEKEDWKKVEKYNRYLISEKRNRFFIKEDKGDKYRVELGLAKALMYISGDLAKELPFVENNLERRLLQGKISSIQEEVRSLLDKLVALDGDETADITTRILAKELLVQFNNNLI
ncbi:MAG: hypothetical protein GWP59_00580 [Chlamydiales bacterium]|nr:hypothetical protein [Chlamydiales bacterium]